MLPKWIAATCICIASFYMFSLLFSNPAKISFELHQGPDPVTLLLTAGRRAQELWPETNEGLIFLVASWTCRGLSDSWSHIFRKNFIYAKPEDVQGLPWRFQSGQQLFSGSSGDISGYQWWCLRAKQQARFMEPKQNSEELPSNTKYQLSTISRPGSACYTSTKSFLRVG